MLRRFSSNRFRFSDGFKSGETVRLNSVQRRSRGCQARFRPSRASSVRLRLRSRGAFARPALVRGGFPPPEVPGSFSRSRLLFRFVAVQLVHGRYSMVVLLVQNRSLDLPVSARSASVPGGRRFRRLRPDPADRSPGPFRSRPLVSSVSVPFVPSVRLLLVSVRLPFTLSACSVRSCSFPFALFRSFLLACSRFPVLPVCLSGSFLSSSRSGLVRFRLVLVCLVQVSFGSA